MKKFDLSLPRRIWGQLKLKYAPDSEFVDFDDFTDGTVNVVTDEKGAITKRKGKVVYNPTALASPVKDQFEAIFSDGVHHLLEVESGEIKFTSGDNIFNTIVNGAGFIAAANFEFATIRDRVYGCNGINGPQVYDRAVNYGGVVYTAPRMKSMGAQAPTTAPTVAIVAGAGVPTGGHKYKASFLYYGFEESNGGLESSLVTIVAGPNQQVDLTSIPIGGYGVTARNIYRDNDDGNFLRIGTINDNTTSTFSDNAPSATFPIPTDNGVPPTFQEITLWLSRSWISGLPGSPALLRFSSPGFPDIFPGNNFLTADEEDPIVAHVVFKGKLVILNRNSMGQILGNTFSTFRYQDIQGAVGCVDARSVQIRTIRGISVLIWLSDKGFYAYNGNSVDYISDSIEPLINLNIQQAQSTKGLNAQTTQQDFTNGVSSPGIDLTLSPGSIITAGPKNANTSIFSNPANPTNPQKFWNANADWEGGDDLISIVTKDTAIPNSIRGPIAAIFTLADGSNNNTIIQGSDITFTTRPDATGPQLGPLGAGFTTTVDTYTACGRALAIVNNGTITNLSATVTWVSSSVVATVALFADSNLSVILGESAEFSFGSPFPNTQTVGSGVSIPVTPGTYFVGLSIKSGAAMGGSGGSGINMDATFGSIRYKRFSDGALIDEGFRRMHVTAEFLQDAIPQSGEWQSAVYDSKLFENANDILTDIAHTGSYPAGTTENTILEQSDSPSMAGAVSQNIASLSGNQNFNFVDTKRYWRVRIQLTTNDDRTNPTVQVPTLKFLTSPDWRSEPLDLSTDVTEYTSAAVTSVVPAGTSVLLEAASSADNISYTAFGSLGAIAVQRYIKFKITLTTNGDNTSSAEVSQIDFRYKLTSNLQSSSIDTGIPPAGWNIFQISFIDNSVSSSVTVEMRSAASLGALPAAAYFSVTNGQIPTLVPLNQFVQWRVTLNSETNLIPRVDDVTVNWFLVAAESIRVASLFFDRRYYLAAAEFGETTNNLLVQLDSSGKWRRLEGLRVNTMGLLFNEPMFGDAVVAKFFRFLVGTDDDGGSINLEVRTRAFNGKGTDERGNPVDDSDKLKILKEVIMTGKNTGASYVVDFSLDQGTTFTAMKASDGATTFVTSTNGQLFVERFRADNSFGNLVTGTSVLVRVTNDDTKEVEIRKLRLRGFTRQGKIARA